MTFAPLDPRTVRQAQQGDLGAREHLLEEVSPRLLPYCRRLARGDSGEAEEIAQETGLRLFRFLADVRDPDRLMSWVLRVATNLWHDRLRGRQDYPLSKDIEDPVTTDVAERREMHFEVSRRLDALPAVYRVALTLRFLEGLDYDAMSVVLGIPQSTVRMQISRGVRLLREGLEGEVSS